MRSASSKGAVLTIEALLAFLLASSLLALALRTAVSDRGYLPVYEHQALQDVMELFVKDAGLRGELYGWLDGGIAHPKLDSLARGLGLCLELRADGLPPARAPEACGGEPVAQASRTFPRGDGFVRVHASLLR